MNPKVLEVVAKLDQIEKIMPTCPHDTSPRYGEHDEPSGTWIVADFEKQNFLGVTGTKRIMQPCKHHLPQYLETGYWKVYLEPE